MATSLRIAAFIACLLVGSAAQATAVGASSLQEALPSLRVVCFGDSITAGVGASNVGVTDYPARLLALLQARTVVQTVTLVNLGKPGEYAYDASVPPPAGSGRFVQTVEFFKPDLVLLLEGVNDITAGLSTSHVVASLGRMVTAAKARGVVVFLATLTPVAPGDNRAEAIAATNVAIRALAASEQVRLVDLEAAFGGDASLLTADGLHPNDFGYARMARAFFDAIAAHQPALHSIVPASGPATGGTTVTLAGANFVPGTLVTFGPATAPVVTVMSGSYATAVTPPGSGTVPVSVVTRFGTATLAGAFTYVTGKAPTITSLFPRSGPANGGTLVTIGGTDFIAGQTSVHFGAIPATQVSVSSPGSLTAVSPAGTGTVAVIVTTPWGTATVGGGFTYGVPVVAGLSPARVRAGGGPFTLVVSGQNFLEGARVSWNGAARPTTVVSATELRASIGSNDVRAPMMVTVTVVNPGPNAPAADTLLEVFGPWTIAGTGSLDPDSMADLVWQSAEGYVAAWRMDGTTQVENALLYPAPAAVDGWRVAAAGDVDGDGDADLVWQHAGGWVAAWVMDGTEQQANALLYDAPVAVDGWRIVAAGDLSGDGKADLVWQNDNGYVAVWVMDGLTQVRNELLYPSPVAIDGWNIVGTGDLGGDGHVDLIWQSDAGYVAAWLMEGTTQDANLLLYPAPVATDGWWVAGAGDLDGDGDADLLFQHAEGWVAAWLMSGTTQENNARLTPPRVW